MSAIHGPLYAKQKVPCAGRLSLSACTLVCVVTCEPEGNQVCPDKLQLLCRRTWFARVAESAEELVRSMLPPNLESAAVELGPYLVDSVGNSTRIDYGTGHETTFCALLCCLAKLGVLAKTDLQVGPRPVMSHS